MLFRDTAKTGTLLLSSNTNWTDQTEEWYTQHWDYSCGQTMKGQRTSHGVTSLEGQLAGSQEWTELRLFKQG